MGLSCLICQGLSHEGHPNKPESENPRRGGGEGEGPPCYREGTPWYTEAQLLSLGSGYAHAEQEHPPGGEMVWHQERTGCRQNCLLSCREHDCWCHQGISLQDAFRVRPFPHQHCHH